MHSWPVANHSSHAYKPPILLHRFPTCMGSQEGKAQRLPCSHGSRAAQQRHRLVLGLSLSRQSLAPLRCPAVPRAIECTISRCRQLSSVPIRRSPQSYPLLGVKLMPRSLLHFLLDTIMTVVAHCPTPCFLSPSFSFRVTRVHIQLIIDERYLWQAGVWGELQSARVSGPHEQRVGSEADERSDEADETSGKREWRAR